MQVTKRNGQKQEVSFDKVKYRLQCLCNGLNIDPIIIAQKVCSRIYDGVSTMELDELSAQICTSMVTTHLDYGVLGSRIIISNNHKNTSPSFSETITLLYNNVDKSGKHCPLVSDIVYKITILNKEKLNNTIDYLRDYTFDYFAFKTLERAYLFKINDKIIERIQHLIMRVSVGLHGDDITSVINSYNYISHKYFTHATPTLFNAGTNNPQLLSCYLIGTDDTLEGIFKTISDCAKISKWAGGIGVHVSNIRSKNAVIRGTNGKSRGILPMLKVYNETMKYINQGGKRAGSAAIYLEPHHPEILEFLEIRKNHGNEEDRARDLFTALWLPDLFMEKIKIDGDWCLFDPDECKGLSEIYGEEYENLYYKYENEKRYRKKIKAREIWKYILNSQIETGTPYILFKDSINKKSNQKNIGTIKSSNLCAEITEFSNEKEYACCCLSSICLPKFIDVETKEFNHEKLIEVVKVVVSNLNKIIDLNFYPVPETKLSNLKHRPLGIGVQGLADVFCMLRIPFESDEANKLNIEIFETLYYASCQASMEQSKIHGSYETFEGSPISQGLFQFDLWDVKPSGRYNWDLLRNDIKKHGIRNSLLIALMPTASTSQIMGNNECFEPYTSNIYTRRTIAGDFIVVNKFLITDLVNLGLWDIDLKNKIIAENGSVQNIKEIPNNIKELYKTVWEIKQKTIIDMAADRAPFVCQTQSMNLFFEEPSHNVLTSALFHGWKRGLKTGCYYIRSRPKVQAQQMTIEPEKKENNNDNNNNDKNGVTQVLYCTRDNPDCEACSG
jgi:ribonucleoside-diphosphate reductase alpha subunit